MAVELTVNAVTATTVTFGIANIPGGDGYAEIQIADNPQFRGLTSWAIGYAVSPYTIAGLNQKGTYYARARGYQPGLGIIQAWGATVGFYTPAAGAWDTAPQNILISPALIVVPEPVLSIAPVGAVPADGYPPANLLRDDPALIFYSGGVAYDGLTYVYLDFDTAGAPIDFVALLDTDAPEAVEFFVWGYTTAARRAADTRDFDPPQVGRPSANLPQRSGYHLVQRFNAPQSFRYWRLLVRAANFRQDRFMARYLVAGLARTAKNISTDKVEGPLDLGTMDRNRAGGPDRVWGHKMRKVEFEISVMREMQWETQFADLWRKIGLSEPVLVIPNSKTGAFLHDRILYGTMAAGRTTQVNSPLFTQGFSIESLI